MGVASVYAGGDGGGAGTVQTGGWAGPHKARAEGREQTRYRGWMPRIVAAGPSIDVESVGADADNTDRDVRTKAGMHSPSRYIGYPRTAFKRPN